MYNFHNEIALPVDKDIQYFLWSDYFHDSQISSIKYDNQDKTSGAFVKPTSICLTVVSYNDLEKYTPNRFNPYELQADDRCIYHLQFKDVLHFSSEAKGYGDRWINGRFKDSALLRTLTKESKKRYYHFRIQTDDGYIDIVFSSFRIQKLKGRIRLGSFKEHDWFQLSARKYLEKNAAGEIDFDNLLAKLNDSIDNRDSDSFEYTFTYLALFTDKNLLEIARKIINRTKEDYSHSRIAAVWVIGKQGENCDISILMEEYLYSDYLPIYKRHIMDAIERIYSRQV